MYSFSSASFCLVIHSHTVMLWFQWQVELSCYVPITFSFLVCVSKVGQTEVICVSENGISPVTAHRIWYTCFQIC